MDMSLDNHINKPNEDSFQNRKEKALDVINFLKRIDVENIVEDPLKKKELVESFSFEDFQNFILRINGIYREVPISSREFNAGADAKYIVNLKREGEVIYCPPSNVDKIPLLREVLDSFKRMVESERYEDAALMLGSLINAIHPFPQGNGRTSRTVATIFASSKDNFCSPQCNPESIQSFIESYIRNSHKLTPVYITDSSDDAFPFPEGASIQDKSDIVNATQSDRENFISACQIFLQDNKFDEQVMSLKDNTMNLGVFLERYKNQMSEVLKIYRNLKKEYVHVLIDVFEFPEKYYIKDIPDIFNSLPRAYQESFARTTLLDVFKMDANRDTVRRSEFSWNFLKKFFKEID